MWLCVESLLEFTTRFVVCLWPINLRARLWRNKVVSVVSVVRISHVLSEYTFFFFVFRVTYLHLLFFVRILYHMYVLSASPIILRKSSFVPLISSYNCCSFIWTVLGLPPLIISPIHLMFWASSCPVLRVFAFACSLFRTTSSCCPHNLVIYPETCGSLKATCKSHPGIPLKNISCGADSHVLQALQVQEAGDRHR